MPLTATEVQKQLEDLSSAIEQLESDQKDLAANLEKRLAKIRSQTWDARGSYRGVFESEDQARAFGYWALSKSFTPEVREKSLKWLEHNARDMSGGTDGSGGATVPIQFSDRMKVLMEQYGAFFRNAFRMPMTSNDLVFMKQLTDPDVYLVGESVAATGTRPTFANVNLTAKKWGAVTYVPRELVDDAIVVIAELLFRSFARAFAKKADAIAFIGDGSATYFGIRGIVTKLTAINGVDDGGGIVVGAGNAYSELALTDFEKVQGRLPEYAGMEPRWYCSRAFYFNVMVKLMLASGGTTAEEIEGRRRRTFLGDPVEFVQVLPKVEANSQICALYGDMSMAATWGDRRALTVEESRDYKFVEGQSTFLATQRVGISVEDLGDADNAGPMVGLMTAAG